MYIKNFLFSLRAIGRLHSSTEGDVKTLKYS